MHKEEPRTIRETITIQSAMTRAGVSRRTIYNWLRDGKVEYVRTAAGSVRIFADTIFRTADRQRFPRGPAPDGLRHPVDHA